MASEMQLLEVVTIPSVNMHRVSERLKKEATHLREVHSSRLLIVKSLNSKLQLIPINCEFTLRQEDKRERNKVPIE